MILAGDIGGTKVRLALFSNQSGTLKKIKMSDYVSQNFATFDEIILNFASDLEHDVTALCIGVAGPVSEGIVNTTNLPWTLSESKIAETLTLRSTKVRLVNDLVATAAQVCHLKTDDLVVVHPGKEQTVKILRAVVAPGTGLGQAAIHLVNGKNIIIPSEGSHIDFAPTNEEEDALLRYTRKILQGRVSVERLVSGPGIMNIYNFFRDSRYAPEKIEIIEKMKVENPSRVVTNAALNHDCPLCEKTLELFCSLLGAHCGNVVLTFMCAGGLYLGGGIPPKIQSKLLDGTFYKAYAAKGRLSSMVEATPVYLVKNDFAALDGAAFIASEL